MKGLHFENIQFFFLLWILPVLTGLYIFEAYMRKKALSVFAENEILKKLSGSVNNNIRIFKMILIILAVTLAVFSMTRPGWNPKPRKIERRGRDIVFLIDVSKSMLAEDLVPNRLARAKLAIIDCVDKLEGDRVGLVAFAGTSAIKCPLTLDYGFFRAMVDDISVYSIERGGTNIGDAIRRILKEMFTDGEKRYKDIILITDGEDHDSLPEEAAKKAGEAGVRIIAIGLGDSGTGKRIPVTDENGQKTFLKYRDRDGNVQEVWTKLDADLLAEMANATPGGKYLIVGTGVFDLGEIYLQDIASAEKRSLESTTSEIYEEKFQIFLLIAFAILLVEPLISIRRRRPS
ncbi:MAG: VWA domain-containing protein [Spirochaetales bacterium]|nr:VWA domain-containing protein [Spirochaetales bacterium]